MRSLRCALLLALLLLTNAQETLKVIKRYSELSTLASILNNTDSDVAQFLLTNSSQYTFLAPTDKAFKEANIDSDNAYMFINLLKYHVIPEIINSTTWESSPFPATLLAKAPLVNLPENKTQVLFAKKDGKYLSVSYGLGGAKIVQPDIPTSNGIIHQVDHVLSPPINPSEVMKAANLTRFLELMRRTGFVNAMDKFKGITMFVPTNAALETLDWSKLRGITLDNLVKYHIVTPTVGYSADLKNGTLPSLHGANLIITKSGTSVTVNNAKLVMQDILTNNGVLHVVDSILKPSPMVDASGVSSSARRAAIISIHLLISIIILHAM
ncbi:Fasciclin-domain-containing protein [Basidiobolus meristosporus CBS 931.73]|uniref:Fasciclin-domain-containing protein n=1 Tax=Basidiobolus meristosporus CBS 931.73 TaxID=1314790 RepID=A0A1Y1YEB3_9FUNG|nr:Fasciclin-domain-containing protein [Basidiobolus meristosporus CBS 931.73]|eukprot:ORX96263.1 Fasciclin-domain-containing protein [Basidiobolus meristosporus CBS 931.73]